MWRNNYKDYKPDEPWQHTSVEPGKGITGCEMHEVNGWGTRVHQHKRKQGGLIRTLLNLLFKKS